MRNMSFMLTTDQIRNQTKTVTRRLGWWSLKPGDRVMACVKCQGIPKGGKIEKICEIEIVSCRAERLNQITEDDVYREGFPQLTTLEFIRMFMKEMKCCVVERVNRIAFKYVDRLKKEMKS